LHDAEIRRALKSYLAAQHEGEDALIIDELGLQRGRARVDVAVVNGAINGYEIKGDFDRLTRLPSQQVIYSRCLDTVTVVTTARHLDETWGLIPEWWGVIEISWPDQGESQFRMWRMGQDNPGVHEEDVASLLWRGELLEILEQLGKASGHRSKPRADLTRRLVATMSVEDLKRTVRDCLKQRRDWRSVSPRR
jgi:hypothetical protein